MSHPAVEEKQLTIRDTIPGTAEAEDRSLHNRCPICASERLRTRWTINGYMIASCEECSLVFVRNVITAAMGVLAKCHRALKPGGLIVIKVHNISCLYAKLTGPNFYALIPPSHLFYYNRQTLDLALGKAGFCTLETRYIGHLLRVATRVPPAIQRQPAIQMAWVIRAAAQVSSKQPQNQEEPARYHHGNRQKVVNIAYRKLNAC